MYADINSISAPARLPSTGQEQGGPRRAESSKRMTETEGGAGRRAAERMAQRSHACLPFDQGHSCWREAAQDCSARGGLWAPAERYPPRDEGPSLFIQKNSRSAWLAMKRQRPQTKLGARPDWGGRARSRAAGWAPVGRCPACSIRRTDEHAYSQGGFLLPCGPHPAMHLGAAPQIILAPGWRAGAVAPGPCLGGRGTRPRALPARRPLRLLRRLQLHAAQALGALEIWQEVGAQLQE